MKEQQYIIYLIDSKIESSTVVSNLPEVSKNKKKPKWAKGLSGGEQMYDMAIAKQEDVNMTGFDSHNLDDYKEQAKHASQKLK